MFCYWFYMTSPLASPECLSILLVTKLYRDGSGFVVLNHKMKSSYQHINKSKKLVISSLFGVTK